MSGLLGWSVMTQKFTIIKITSNLLLLTTLIIFLQNNEIAFSQTGNEIGLPTDPNSMTTPDLTISNESAGSSQGASGFVANGKINTVIDVPNGKWLAAGNWSIIVNNGNVTSFDTKMTWYNSSGTNAHTHDLTNFKSISGDTQVLPMNTANRQTIIEGFTDVASNERTSWFEVPTTITINDGKIISISVDDNNTNGHFGGQPLLGIVDSFVPCSDVPGPNMELLPPCSLDTAGEEVFGLMNDTSTFPPSKEFMPQGTFAGEDFSQQGVPDQGFLGEDFSQQGVPDQGFPGEDFSQQGSPGGQSSSEDDEIGEQPPSQDDQTGTGEINPACTNLNIENVTANGFETDPSDYHPPSDSIDGNSSTWWSNNGEDPWLEILLSEPHTICGVSVEWNKGNQRDYSFEIEVSEDGNNYKKVFEGNNRQDSSESEVYSFEEELSGKFIKLTVTSTSSQDGWVSVREIGVLGLP
ncbi:MAG TPA: discoidin domain-containing protein [Nitrososphaeraceae archaeon]|nr:discoidin domain-containing protein [Nitrososphaeraceae archaeon]